MMSARLLKGAARAGRRGGARPWPWARCWWRPPAVTPSIWAPRSSTGCCSTIGGLSDLLSRMSPPAAGRHRGGDPAPRAGLYKCRCRRPDLYGAACVRDRRGAEPARKACRCLVALLAASLAGALGGALWGRHRPVCSRPRRGIDEVVTTLLMNYVALNLVSYAASGPLKAPGAPLPLFARNPRSELPAAADGRYRGPSGGDRGPSGRRARPFRPWPHRLGIWGRGGGQIARCRHLCRHRRRPDDRDRLRAGRRRSRALPAPSR